MQKNAHIQVRLTESERDAWQEQLRRRNLISNGVLRDYIRRQTAEWQAENTESAA